MDYFTTMTDYTAARQALITASRDLFGPDSAEEQAVWNPMRGINVGPAWPAAPGWPKPARTRTTPG